ncbi:MAG: hypothetical protein N3A58_00230 [Spirochaetes bacterium]|nr:hypothetical protein [Spirochaetota bacterium]
MLIYYIFLKDLNYKEDIALALTSSSLNSTLFIESININKLLQLKLPLFSGLFNTNIDNDSGLFIGFTENKENLNNFLKLLQESGVINSENSIFNIFYFEVNSF